MSSESVVSIALAHTGTAASEKSTLVQALHHGCITLVGKNKTDHLAKKQKNNHSCSQCFITDISGQQLPNILDSVNLRDGPDFKGLNLAPCNYEEEIKYSKRLSGKNTLALPTTVFNHLNGMGRRSHFSH